MGAALETAAREVGCSERTLRRYVGDGLLRGHRAVPGRLEIALEEQSYLRSHWALLSQLKSVLRTERDVRLAVLFGSTAVGEDHLGSDVDVPIAHRHSDELRLAGLRLRLNRALGTAVHVISLEQAQTSPSLLADILQEGRPLIDRDGLWRTLQAKRNDVLAEAVREEQATAAEAHFTIAAARASHLAGAA
jgi:predicted nucleotidyltransferase